MLKLEYILNDTHRGVLQQKDPVFYETAEKIVISFYFKNKPSKDLTLKAIFINDNGTSSPVDITQFKTAELPKGVIYKQKLGVNVAAFDSCGRLVEIWKCQPLVISSLDIPLKQISELSPDFDELFTIVKELHSQLGDMIVKYNDLEKRLIDAESKLAEVGFNLV